MATRTTRFGVGRRESHDATDFYARFTPPEVSADDELGAAPVLDDPFVVGDSRKMAELPDRSVALVATSPPYFAGKEYEEALGQGNVPGSYLEYLEMLRDVFAECKRALEPGGRIAVNVANLGRKPYRSLSADVVGILQDDLGLLLRGEIVWQKGMGAAGSCAWGSYRRAANPVLRDLTERVVIASKGRFDRARSAAARRAARLPHESTLTTDEFLDATLDVWTIPSESARRVRHPAPFPVELPQRLIELYTYRDDLVLDPFMGSGTTLVAAARAGRRFVGYDTDPEYVAIARERVGDELAAVAARDGVGDPVLAAAAAEGKAAPAIAEAVLARCGFAIEARNERLPGLGVTVSVVATDRGGTRWYFDVSGAFTTVTAGLHRVETAWRSIGRAHVLAASGRMPVVLLTSHLPRRDSEPDLALRAAGPATCFDVIAMLSADGQQRLTAYAAGGHADRPLPGFWP